MPWLHKIAEEIETLARAGRESGVVACSALKRSYSGHHHRSPARTVTLVYLKGSHDLIRRRMAARHEHFMPVALLDSQFATLQEPTPDEHPIIVDVGGRPAEIAAGDRASARGAARSDRPQSNLHRAWREPRKPRQESDNDTPGKRDSELVRRG